MNNLTGTVHVVDDDDAVRLALDSLCLSVGDGFEARQRHLRHQLTTRLRKMLEIIRRRAAP